MSRGRRRQPAAQGWQQASRGWQPVARGRSRQPAACRIYQQYTHIDKQRVFQMYDEGESLANIERETGVKKSTMQGWLKNPNIILGSGKTCVFTKYQEELMSKVLIYSQDHGFAVGRDYLGDLVQDFCIDNNIRNPFPNGRPQEKWFRYFERRNKLNIKRRKKEGLSLKRAQALSEENRNEFYNSVYKMKYEKAKIAETNKTHVLWNADETCFQPCRNNARVYCRAESKHA